MSRDLWIDGTWQGACGPALTRTCPARGETVWSGACADPADVARAVASARTAFEDWAHSPQDRRTRILEAYRDAIAGRAEDIATTISRDMGKPLWDARGEAGAMAAKVDLSIKAQHERAGTRSGETAFGSMHLSHRPHGVMAVFGPFNFPGHLPNGHIVPALLAGNTCVFKPSELAPGVAVIMAEAFAEAGLPPGCLNIVQGGRETGAALLASDINGVLFTGSAATGTAFHRKFAGRPEIILALEMGGNNPLIVWDPADVDAAADIAAQSAYLTTGQRCTCARRLVLPEGPFGDAVIEAIAARATGLAIGAWDEPDVFMGPLVSPDAAQAALDHQAMLDAQGGQVIKPLEKLERGHGFVSPGIVDVTDARDIPDAELFGPLLQVIRVGHFEQAISAANATRFGLSGGLVCDDDARWVSASARMRAGILNRNRPTVGASGSMPFGGPGLSGNARPGAWYAADYCAWPQASQVAHQADRLTAPGFG